MFINGYKMTQSCEVTKNKIAWIEIRAFPPHGAENPPPHPHSQEISRVSSPVIFHSFFSTRENGNKTMLFNQYLLLFCLSSLNTYAAFLKDCIHFHDRLATSAREKNWMTRVIISLDIYIYIYADEGWQSATQLNQNHSPSHIAA